MEVVEASIIYQLGKLRMGKAFGYRNLPPGFDGDGWFMMGLITRSDNIRKSWNTRAQKCAMTWKADDAAEAAATGRQVVAREREREKHRKMMTEPGGFVGSAEDMSLLRLLPGELLTHLMVFPDMFKRSTKWSVEAIRRQIDLRNHRDVVGKISGLKEAYERAKVWGRLSKKPLDQGDRGDHNQLPTRSSMDKAQLVKLLTRILRGERSAGYPRASGRSSGRGAASQPTVQLHDQSCSESDDEAGAEPSGGHSEDGPAKRRRTDASGAATAAAPIPTGTACAADTMGLKRGRVQSAHAGTDASSASLRSPTDTVEGSAPKRQCQRP